MQPDAAQCQSPPHFGRGLSLVCPTQLLVVVSPWVPARSREYLVIENLHQSDYRYPVAVRRRAINSELCANAQLTVMAQVCKPRDQPEIRFCGQARSDERLRVV